MPRRTHESLGELISTVCFMGLGLLAFLMGFGAFDDNQILRALGLWLAAILLFMGGMRFRIARLYDSWRGRS